MGAIDALTRFFDNLNGAQNTYHASSMTDSQRQKMYDDRADSLQRQYDSEWGNGNYNFKDAKNGNWTDSFYQDIDDSSVRGKYGSDFGFDTVAYDFYYKYPTAGDGGYYSDSVSTPSNNGYGTARVFMRVPKDYSGDNALADGTAAVYGAVLEDGTRLDAEQLREFLKINGIQNDQPLVSVKNAAVGSGSNIRDNYENYADRTQDKFFNYLNGNSGTINPRWDKGSRTWRTWK